MKTLVDVRNSNVYLVGEYKGKQFLFNGIFKYEITEARLQHLKEITLNQESIYNVLHRIKRQFNYDFNSINFII